MLFPLVDGRLVIPPMFGIASQGTVDHLKQLRLKERAVRLHGFALEHYNVRLRTVQLRNELKLLLCVNKPEQLLIGAERALARCLERKVQNVDPLDVADDYLAVAGSLASSNNLMLAGLALKEASRVFDTVISLSAGIEEMASVKAFRKGLATLADYLKRGDA